MDNRESIGRRGFLRLMAGAALLAALPRRVWAYVVETFRTRTVEEGLFRFDPATGEVILDGGRREPYALVVDGLVEHPLRLSYADLRGLPQTAQVSDFHCVEGWSVLDVPWSGVRFAEIARMAGPKAGATHAVLHALGRTEPVDGVEHYLESLPLADLLRPELGYLLALDLEGRPLSHDRGAPMRLVCPFDLAYKSIKFVTRIEFTDKPRPGWWTLANPIYPVHAPVGKHRLRAPDPRG